MKSAQTLQSKDGYRIPNRIVVVPTQPGQLSWPGLTGHPGYDDSPAVMEKKISGQAS
jgi:hypothetical protein